MVSHFKPDLGGQKRQSEVLSHDQVLWKHNVSHRFALLVKEGEVSSHDPIVA